MLNWIKKILKSGNDDGGEQDYTFKWYEADDSENPFNKKILDVRSFTQTVTAATTDQLIAASFSANRSSDGREFRGKEIPNAASIETNLVYPHNGERLEGVVFKADEMEVKWDIYIYDDCFFFVRSWSGELVYKARAEITSDQIIIKNIDYAADTDAVYAVNAVHFLIKSHAFGQPFPHYVTDLLENEKSIAVLSFSQFGNKACYACFEEITDTLILDKRSKSD